MSIDHHEKGCVNSNSKIPIITIYSLHCFNNVSKYIPRRKKGHEHESTSFVLSHKDYIYIH